MESELDPLENLELLAAACSLAPDVFYARGQAFGVSGEWSMLDAGARQFYIDRCLELLQRLQPMRTLTFRKWIHGDAG
jgi:hypothetical protein